MLQFRRMKVKVENKSDKEQTVSVVLRADATLYTGRVTGCVKKQTFTETIPPNEGNLPPPLSPIPQLK